MNLHGFVGNSPLNAVDPMGLADLWMSPDGKVHTGKPPSEQRPADPNSLAALHGFGDITDGQQLGDFFLNDVLVPAGEKSAELGLYVAMMVSGLGEGEGAYAAADKALNAARAAKAAKALKCNWKSVKQFGHTFTEHGAKRPLQQLIDRANSHLGPEMGQWLDNDKAAQFLKQYLDIGEPVTVQLPEGLGRVVLADGTTVPATAARIFPNSTRTGLTTAIPIR